MVLTSLDSSETTYQTKAWYLVSGNPYLLKKINKIVLENIHAMEGMHAGCQVNPDFVTKLSHKFINNESLTLIPKEKQKYNVPKSTEGIKASNTCPSI